MLGTVIGVETINMKRYNVVLILENKTCIGVDNDCDVAEAL